MKRIFAKIQLGNGISRIGDWYDSDKTDAVIAKQQAEIDDREYMLHRVYQSLRGDPSSWAVCLRYDISILLPTIALDTVARKKKLGIEKELAKQQTEIAELVEWLRYEMEEAGIDDEKDEAYNANGAKLLAKHRVSDMTIYKQDYEEIVRQAEEAQAEINELVDMLENMCFNNSLHHNDAVELLVKHRKGE